MAYRFAQGRFIEHLERDIAAAALAGTPGAGGTFRT
jgi:hypothetical protein